MNFTEGALFGDNINAQWVFGAYRNDQAKSFAEFTRGFCEKTLIAQFLNRFGRKELLAGADGWILEFEDGVRTMLKGGVLSVAQGDALVAEGGTCLCPLDGWVTVPLSPIPQMDMPTVPGLCRHASRFQVRCGAGQSMRLG